MIGIQTDNGRHRAVCDPCRYKGTWQAGWGEANGALAAHKCCVKHRKNTNAVRVRLPA